MSSEMSPMEHNEPVSEHAQGRAMEHAFMEHGLNDTERPGVKLGEQGIEHWKAEEARLVNQIGGGQFTMKRSEIEALERELADVRQKIRSHEQRQAN